MALETDIIMRSVLYQLKTAKSLQDAINAIEAMAGQELVEAVENVLEYDTKVLITAIASIVKKSQTVEEVYAELAKMANVEGIILEPFEKDENKNKETQNQSR